MQTDKTTKTLLFFIAVALWGLLLRPLVTPAPAIAQPPLLQPVRIVAVDGSLPVTITKQTVPVEVRPAARETFTVEISGQRGPINVRSLP